MASDPVHTKEIAETFDELAHDRCCKYKSKGLTASTEVLLGLLTENGLVGKTLLDIGCGTGFFALETLRQGASFWIGVDLTSPAIHEMNELAIESGLQDRAGCEVAVAAFTQHAADIVVLDNVLYSYPDEDSLLKTT